MATYTESELLNEVSQIYRANLSPSKEGGVLNTKEEYNQLLEMSASTLLLYPDAVFYIAVLAKNKLMSLVNQEVDIIEDMLIALDDLGQLGDPITDTATLNNAKTALLALDAASSVSGRPELDRFTNLMDKFAEGIRPNVISPSGNFVRPRENARLILLEDMTRLTTVHERMLDSLLSLRDMLLNFVSVDIPSQVASSIFTSIRTALDNLISDIETGSSVDNVAKSRQMLLTSLASKSSVDSVASFRNPDETKVRCPIDPIPSTISHLGRVTGTGSPGSVISSAGPWFVPFASSEPLDISVNGATPVAVGVDAALGAMLDGRNKEVFTISTNTDNLHVTVDPNTYKGTVNTGTQTSATLNEFLSLGYKHVGCPVWFSGDGTWGAITEPSGQPNPDFNARIITEMRLLQTTTIIAVYPICPGIVQISAVPFVAGDEPGTGFGVRHIGAYIKQGSNRYEIIQIISASGVYISVPTGMSNPSLAAADIRGQTIPAIGTKFDFLPTLDVGNANNAAGVATIGPAIKTASLVNSGSKTVAQIVTDIVSEVGSYLSFGTMSAMQSINRHVRASAVAGDPTRLALTPRSRFKVYLAISATFPQVQTAPANPLVQVADSAHIVLGFSEGQVAPAAYRTPALDPYDLAGMISDGCPTATSEVVETELGSGESLQTVLGTGIVMDPNVSFDSLVSPKDQIEIFGGSYSGTYQIASALGSQLSLYDILFTSSENSLKYRIFRQQVRISSSGAVDASIQVTDGPYQLGFTTEVQYASIPSFEAVNNLGERYPFNEVSPGDLLRIGGSSQLVEINDVVDGVLSLNSGLPSNLKNSGFEVKGGSAKVFTDMETKLTTLTTSPNLLMKHGFDTDVSAVDNALTSAVLPGSSFVSSRNQAKQVLADLLSMLTDSPKRSSEYSAVIPTASLSVDAAISSYTSAKSEPVERLIEAFRDRKYERASSLLSSGRFSEFFATDEETGSFGGAVMAAARTTAQDLPEVPIISDTVAQSFTTAVQSRSLSDSDTSFDEYDPSEEISE